MAASSPPRSGQPGARWAAILESEAAPGILLMLCAVAALIVANSPLYVWYDALISTQLSVSLGEAVLAKPLLLWINDGLMALFFLLVGIELKHELLFGHLRSRRQFALPAVAAVGGMVVPAAVYLSLNAADPVARGGWAIPAATDIAFALAIFAMLARGLPAEVKVFLLAIAILDDIGAIVIIAAFYTADLSLVALFVAAGLGGALLVLNRFVRVAAAPFLLVGAALWLATLQSGVHATMAGVLLGLALPLRTGDPDRVPAGYRVEHGIRPWVYFAILPVFALANAGVRLVGTDLAAAVTPMVVGIALGLAVGKPLGIVGFVWLGERLRLVTRPPELPWRVVLGVGCLCGIGFTMSLFIGSLAFEHDPAISLGDERVGILVGSLLATIFATLVLRGRTTPKPTSSSH